MSRLPAYSDVEIQSEQRVWDGRFPLDVIRFRHRRFDGAMSGQRTWELWRRGRAAAVLPYDPRADAVVLIEQFRLPALAAGVDPVLLELPAGLCDADEPPKATAQREMLEEVGFAADRLEPIGGFLLTPGGSDEICFLYAGCVHLPVATSDVLGHAGMAAEQEDIRVRVWPAAEALAAAFDGRVTNVLTAVGLYWLAARREYLREKWKDS
jgi:ADP-ribose pyrophosphatase